MTKLRNAVGSSFATNIKLSKPQISKLIQSGGLVGAFFLSWKLQYFYLKTLLLGLASAASAAGAGIQKKRKIQGSSGTLMVVKVLFVQAKRRKFLIPPLTNFGIQNYS